MRDLVPRKLRNDLVHCFIDFWLRIESVDPSLLIQSVDPYFVDRVCRSLFCYRVCAWVINLFVYLT
jgi:hypothetical protein